MTFIWPWMLLSLLLIPLFVWLYVRLRRRRALARLNLGPLSGSQALTGNGDRWRVHVPPFLSLIALSFLFLGLARPQMFVDLPRVEGTVILAFDVSGSMTAEDLEPSRMEAAKDAARTFVENQPPTIQVGVVAFSSGGLVVQTPTNIQADVLATIDRLSPQEGTSLGQGIFASLNAIAGEAIALDEGALEEAAGRPSIGHFPSAVVILLSDGENTDPPEPLEIAQLAAEAGVRIYPIGIGSVEGSILNIDGFNMLTQLNETVLQQIADLTNGAYFRAQDAEELATIYEDIDLQLTISGDEMEITGVIAGISLLFFLAGGVLSLLWYGRAP